MVVVGIRLMPPKVIKKNVYLWAKGPSRLSKDLGPKKMPKHLKERRVKGSKGYMKMEYGGVHHNKYDGYYTKQWV